MQRKEITQWSSALGQDMHLLTFGDAGWPLVVFPVQDGSCTNWEDFGLADIIAQYVDSGRVQLWCLDCIDQQSWSFEHGDPSWRTSRQEAYVRYVTNEALPLVAEHAETKRLPVVTGCSMGATHAAICFLRYPSLFSGLFAMSGVYDASFFFGSWRNSTLYLNSPTDFLPGMHEDHPYVRLYNQRTIVMCCGQGAWEDEERRTLAILRDQFERLGVHATCDFWGFDVNHDWPWWKKQLKFYLPQILDAIGA